MSVSDFLFNGSAPPSTSTYGSTVTNVPTWYSDYTQGLIAKANAIGAEPYQLYGGPRIAGFTPDSESAFNLNRQNIGAFNPTLNSATSYASGAPGAASPFVNAGSDYLGSAGALTKSAVGPGTGGLSAAMPWLNSASGTYTGANVDQYMSPYIGGVIDRATQLANRNFQENILPGLNDQFISAGQPGSSRNAEMVGRAARDVTEGLQGQALGALNSAYTTGGQLFGQDMSRMAGLGSTVGQLGSQQQNAQLGAGQQLGAIGQAFGNIGQQQGQLGLNAADAMRQLATTGQQMANVDVASLAAAGQQQQGLNQQNLNLAYQDFQNQQQYPRQTIDWLNSVLKGIPQLNTSTNSATSASTGATGATGFGTLAGLATQLYGLGQQSARGGLIGYRRGGPVRGALSRMN